MKPWGLMTHLLNPFWLRVYKQSHLDQIAAETIETWYTHSSKGDTPKHVLKLCFHGNTLAQSPKTSF